MTCSHWVRDKKRLVRSREGPGLWSLTPLSQCQNQLPSALPFTTNTPRDGRKQRFQEADSGPTSPFHHILPFVHPNQAILASSLLLQLDKLVPTSGPLHILFLLSDTCIFQLFCMAGSFSSFQSWIKCYLLRQALTDTTL